MIFDAAVELDIHSAKTRLDWLIDNKKVFELTEKKAKRSISQNSYLHLILSWFGLHFGYTLKEVKQDIFKKHVSPELFYNGEKTGVIMVEIWRSTSELDTGEMAQAIERFRNFSSTEGLYLPQPEDSVMVNQIDRELKKHSSKVYL